jgi:hypothetical protein
MPWWQAPSTIIEALAGAAVAWFAGATWRSDNRRKRQRATEVASRISTTAFQLRRQLRSWLSRDSKPVSPLTIWLQEHKQDYGKHLDVAEHRLEEMATLAGEASARVATRVRMAFVLFLGGTRRLTEYASTARPRDETQFDYDRLVTDAEKDLRACIDALEDGVIDAELLRADRELDEIRNAEDPFKQLAEAILRGQS